MTKKHIIMPNELEDVELNDNANENQNENADSKAEENQNDKNFESPEAKRARLTRQLEQLDKKYPKAKEEQKFTQTKSDDFDYGQKAYLLALGIKDKEEISYLKKVMADTGKDLESVTNNKYVIADLEEMREIKKTSQVAPNSNRSTNVSTDSVEYWMTKDFKDVPKDLKQKVLNAKITSEKAKGMFYNS